MSETTVPLEGVVVEKKSLKRFVPSKKTLAIVGGTAATVLAAVGLYAKGRTDETSPIDDYIPVGVHVETLSELENPDQS